MSENPLHKDQTRYHNVEEVPSLQSKCSVNANHRSFYFRGCVGMTRYILGLAQQGLPQRATRSNDVLPSNEHCDGFDLFAVYSRPSRIISSSYNET